MRLNLRSIFAALRARVGRRAIKDIPPLVVEGAEPEEGSKGLPDLKGHQGLKEKQDRKDHKVSPAPQEVVVEKNGTQGPAIQASWPDQRMGTSTLTPSPETSGNLSEQHGPSASALWVPQGLQELLAPPVQPELKGRKESRDQLARQVHKDRQARMERQERKARKAIKGRREFKDRQD